MSRNCVQLSAAAISTVNKDGHDVRETQTSFRGRDGYLVLPRLFLKVYMLLLLLLTNNPVTGSLLSGRFSTFENGGFENWSDFLSSRLKPGLDLQGPVVCSLETWQIRMR